MNLMRKLLLQKKSLNKKWKNKLKTLHLMNNVQIFLIFYNFTT